MLSKILLSASMLAVSLHAMTQHVAYTGGKQSGSVALRGTDGPADLPIILELDSALRITAFTGESPSASGSGPTDFWLFLENSVGSVGYRNSSDTTWNEATGFPVTPLRLDSLVPVQDPLGRFWPANMEGKVRQGLKIRHLERSYAGTRASSSIDRIAGDGRTLYFKLNKPSGVRYGKVMVVRDSVETITAVIDGHLKLVSVTVNYMLFDSTHLDPTPMSLRASPAKQKAGARLHWSERDGLRLRDARGRLHDLHGRRVPDARP